MKKTILSLTAGLTMFASAPAIYAAPVVEIPAESVIENQQWIIDEYEQMASIVKSLNEDFSYQDEMFDLLKSQMDNNDSNVFTQADVEFVRDNQDTIRDVVKETLSNLAKSSKIESISNPIGQNLKKAGVNQEVAKTVCLYFKILEIFKVF